MNNRSIRLPSRCGFEDEVDGAQGVHFKDFSGVEIVGREENNRGISGASPLTNHSCSFEAIHVRHVDVQ